MFDLYHYSAKTPPLTLHTLWDMFSSPLSEGNATFYSEEKQYLHALK